MQYFDEAFITLSETDVYFFAPRQHEICESLDLVLCVLSGGTAILLGHTLPFVKTMKSILSSRPAQIKCCHFPHEDVSICGCILKQSEVSSGYLNQHKKTVTLALKSGEIEIIDLRFVAHSLTTDGEPCQLHSANPTVNIPPPVSNYSSDSVRALRYAEDGKFFGVAYTSKSLSLFNFLGVPIYGTSGSKSPQSSDPMDKSKEVLSIEFVNNGLAMLLATAKLPENCSADLVEVNFHRSAECGIGGLISSGGKYCDSHDHCKRLFFSNNDIVLVDSTISPPYTPLLRQLSQLCSIYSIQHHPVQTLSMNPAATDILITGKCGFALTSLKRNRWSLMGDEGQEMSLITDELPSGWYTSFIFFVTAVNNQDRVTYEKSREEFMAKQQTRFNLSDNSDIPRKDPFLSKEHNMIFFDSRLRLDTSKSLCSYTFHAAPVCTTVFLDPGASSGLSKEDRIRRSHGMPIYTSLDLPIIPLSLYSTSNPSFLYKALKKEGYAPPLIGVLDCTWHLHVIFLVRTSKKDLIFSDFSVAALPSEWGSYPFSCHLLYKVNLACFGFNRFPMSIRFYGSPYHFLLHQYDGDVIPLLAYSISTKTSSSISRRTDSKEKNQRFEVSLGPVVCKGVTTIFCGLLSQISFPFPFKGNTISRLLPLCSSVESNSPIGHKLYDHSTSLGNSRSVLFQNTPVVVSCSSETPTPTDTVDPVDTVDTADEKISGQRRETSDSRSSQDKNLVKLFLSTVQGTKDSSKNKERNSEIRQSTQLAWLSSARGLEVLICSNKQPSVDACEIYASIDVTDVFSYSSSVAVENSPDFQVNFSPVACWPEASVVLGLVSTPMDTARLPSGFCIDGACAHLFEYPLMVSLICQALKLGPKEDFKHPTKAVEKLLKKFVGKEMGLQSIEKCFAFLVENSIDEIQSVARKYTESSVSNRESLFHLPPESLSLAHSSQALSTSVNHVRLHKQMLQNTPLYMALVESVSSSLRSLDPKASSAEAKQSLGVACSIIIKALRNHSFTKCLLLFIKCMHKAIPMRIFTSFCVTALRVVEPGISPILVCPFAGLEPVSLFQTSIRNKEFRTASSLLVILQNLTGPIQVRATCCLQLLEAVLDPTVSLTTSKLFIVSSVKRFFCVLYKVPEKKKSIPWLPLTDGDPKKSPPMTSWNSLPQERREAADVFVKFEKLFAAFLFECFKLEAWTTLLLFVGTLNVDLVSWVVMIAEDLRKLYKDSMYDDLRKESPKKPSYTIHTPTQEPYNIRPTVLNIQTTFNINYGNLEDTLHDGPGDEKKIPSLTRQQIMHSWSSQEEIENCNKNPKGTPRVEAMRLIFLSLVNAKAYTGALCFAVAAKDKKTVKILTRSSLGAKTALAHFISSI
eukprot:GHVP01032661.1.p1 GENE.GHVP01032661.1~~GHVP01032661.1.p1  ORF type:complete len:1364 (-),score=242.31 GHVP01032661.1:70-4161(-)